MSRKYSEVQRKFTKEIQEAESMKEVLEVRARNWPDRQYLTFAPDSQSLTYDEVNTEANRIGNGLSQIGVKKGDTVGLYLENSLEYVKLIYGCAKIGAIETPIDWNYREREVRHAVESAEISTVVVQADEEFLDNVRSVAQAGDLIENIIVVGPGVGRSSRTVDEADAYTLEDVRAGSDETDPGTELTSDDPCGIIYTSGTTGLPKPTLLSNRSFILGAKSFRGAPFPETDVNYNPYPLFHSNSQIFSMLGSAVAGGEYVIGDSFSVSAFWDHICYHDVTSINLIGGVPQMLHSTFEEDEIPDNSLSVAIGPISKEIKENFESKFGLKVINIYGQTESPTLIMNHPDPDKTKLGSIGKPMFPDLGHEVAVLDDGGNEVSSGESGELTRTDPAAMLGYYNQPEKTEETLRDGRIYSGDIVRQDKEGYLYYLGRKKFMIRRSGENISPNQIENVLEELPQIKEAGIIPVPDEIRDEEVKALLRGGTDEITPEEIVLHVANNLATYKTPRYIEFVDEFPKTPSERIKRNDLAEEEKERDDHGWDRDKSFPEWKDRID